MPKTREEKEQIVAELSEKINNAKSLVFADFHGLNVDQSEEIRRECYENNIEFQASKKTLLKLALDKAGLEDIDPKKFEGGVATVISEEDQVAPAKLSTKFAEEFDAIKVFGGILEKSFISAERVKNLAELPSKKELQAQLVSVLNSPISGLVNALNSNASNLVNVLNSIKDQKES